MSTPLDDQLPDQPEPAGETDVERCEREQLAAQGLIKRGSILFDADRDWRSVRVLQATLRELSEHLREVTAERNRLAEELFAVTTLHRKTSRLLEGSLQQAARLQREIDGLIAQVGALRHRTD